MKRIAYLLLLVVAMVFLSGTSYAQCVGGDCGSYSIGYQTVTPTYYNHGPFVTQYQYAIPGYRYNPRVYYAPSYHAPMRRAARVQQRVFNRTYRRAARQESFFNGCVGGNCN